MRQPDSYAHAGSATAPRDRVSCNEPGTGMSTIAPRVYISGLYSGPNPSPGLGVARSVRVAYPAATLIGVDYSNRITGLHWPDFDEIWLQRPWDELDLTTYSTEIGGVLEQGAVWISGLDLEVHWMAFELSGVSTVLVPGPSSLAAVTKPEIEAHRGLPLVVPPFAVTTLPDWELHSFCRANGWQVWLKGPYYEAYRVNDWQDLNRARKALETTWATKRLFLQAHVTGYEESIALSAYKGNLLDAVYMVKHEVTPEGKTWSARVTDVPEAIMRPLRSVVKDLNWTGGAELEMIRDMDGTRWVIDWNPRFPAWIHGATLAGRNLPGLLVEAATGLPSQAAPATTQEFARVVIELPVQAAFPLPPAAEPASIRLGASHKHPSGMPLLAKRLHSLEGPREMTPTQAEKPSLPVLLVEDLRASDPSDVQTPSRVFLERTAAHGFTRMAAIVRQISSSTTQIEAAYSIKTNPDGRLLKSALGSGLLAEAISLSEVRRALQVGFSPDRIILNGPGKWWPPLVACASPLRAIFCDSLEDWRRVVSRAKQEAQLAQTVGVRLRPPMIESRFGIPVDDLDDLRALIEAIRDLPATCSFGLHFHIPRSVVGEKQWWQVYTSILKWSQAIETVSDKPIECLDLGGGWFPDDLGPQVQSLIESAVAEAEQCLHHVRSLIVEPGRALAQPSMALISRVLDVRRTRGRIADVVVDASIAELPESRHYPHRIGLFEPNLATWQPVSRGKARILGRLCMEDDVLAMDVDMPEGLRVGDMLAVFDAGAYDRSMSYEFGR